MVLFVLFGLFGVRPYFAIQSDNPETVEGGIVYTSICCVFSVGCFASILGERLLQSTGRTVHTMITQSIGAIINIILDPFSSTDGSACPPWALPARPSRR